MRAIGQFLGLIYQDDGTWQIFGLTPPRWFRGRPKRTDRG